MAKELKPYQVAKLVGQKMKVRGCRGEAVPATLCSMHIFRPNSYAKDMELMLYPDLKCKKGTYWNYIQVYPSDLIKVEGRTVYTKKRVIPRLGR